MTEVRQITAGVSRGDHQCEALILVQKKAPLDLLLGTNLQSKVGSSFWKPVWGNCHRPTAVADMETESSRIRSMESVLPFQSESVIKESTARSVTVCGEGSTLTTVRLISATRLPARHSKCSSTCR